MTIFKLIISIRYRDIGELMKRCETLVVTRDESKSTLKRVEAEIVREEDGLIAFKDVMNEKILKLRCAYKCELFSLNLSRNAKALRSYAFFSPPSVCTYLRLLLF